MPRLTITLTPARHRALKETAARQGTTIGAIIDESLERAGIKSSEEVAAILARARRKARMDERSAVALAVRETRAVRRVRRRRSAGLRSSTPTSW